MERKQAQSFCSIRNHDVPPRFKVGACPLLGQHSTSFSLKQTTIRDAQFKPDVEGAGMLVPCRPATKSGEDVFFLDASVVPIRVTAGKCPMDLRKDSRLELHNI